MWWKDILIAAVVLAIILAAELVYGSYCCESAAKQMRARLEAGRLSTSATTYDSHELDGLPTPVQNYFRAVLTHGQPIVSGVIVELTGTFNMSETREKWKPFKSRQRIITRRPGFLWEGRIRMMPGLTAWAHDAYVSGEGILHATLLGLVPLANLRGTRQMAQGELMRFLAETAWYPTALLPNQGVHWVATDSTSAEATLQDGETTVRLLFRFGDSGLIESVRAQARGRAVRGAVIPTPWECRWMDYEFRDGMRIPLEGEVAWILPEGLRPYLRGRITRIHYKFAERPNLAE
jgi:hypothetical protein